VSGEQIPPPDVCRVVLDAHILKYGYRIELISGDYASLLRRDAGGWWNVVVSEPIDKLASLYELALNRIEQKIYDEGKEQRSFEIKQGIVSDD